jgi:hypothetical protein
MMTSKYKYVLVVLVSICWINVGCHQPTGTGGGKGKSKVVATGITELSRRATIAALKAEADEIDKLADDIEKEIVKYDGPLAERLKQAAEKGQMTGEASALGKAMIPVLSPKDPKFDPAKVAPALRQLAAGKRLPK